MSGDVVVDASIVVKWLVTEEDSDLADALRATWVSEGVQLAAPRFLVNEVTNALRKKIEHEGLDTARAIELLQEFRQIDIEYFDFPELYPRAILLSLEIGHPSTYDPTFLALAEHLGCDYWLADGKFYDRAHLAGYPVRFLTERRPESPPAP